MNVVMWLSCLFDFELLLNHEHEPDVVATVMLESWVGPEFSKIHVLLCHWLVLHMKTLLHFSWNPIWIVLKSMHEHIVCCCLCWKHENTWYMLLLHMPCSCWNLNHFPMPYCLCGLVESFCFDDWWQHEYVPAAVMMMLLWLIDFFYVAVEYICYAVMCYCFDEHDDDEYVNAGCFETTLSRIFPCLRVV